MPVVAENPEIITRMHSDAVPGAITNAVVLTDSAILQIEDRKNLCAGTSTRENTDQGTHYPHSGILGPGICPPFQNFQPG
jgi:hypothetical protein